LSSSIFVAWWCRPVCGGWTVAGLLSPAEWLVLTIVLFALALLVAGAWAVRRR
jgi:hypothetical protein